MQFQRRALDITEKAVWVMQLCLSSSSWRAALSSGLQATELHWPLYSCSSHLYSWPTTANLMGPSQNSGIYNYPPQDQHHGRGWWVRSGWGSPGRGSPGWFPAEVSSCAWWLLWRWTLAVCAVTETRDILWWASDMGIFEHVNYIIDLTFH